MILPENYILIIENNIQYQRIIHINVNYLQY